MLWQSIVCRHCTVRLYCSAMAVLCMLWTLQCKALCYGGKGVTRHISLLQGSPWNGFYPPWDITWILQTTIAPIILSDAIAYNVNKKRWQTKISRTKTACGQWCVRQSTIYRTGHYHPISGDKVTEDDSTALDGQCFNTSHNISLKGKMLEDKIRDKSQQNSPTPSGQWLWRTTCRQWMMLTW